MGYVQVAARELNARGFTVNLNNLGFPAHVLSRRLQDLGTQYGRAMTGNFLEQQAPFVMSNTTLVTIFAGANDVDTDHGGSWRWRGRLGSDGSDGLHQ